MALSNSMDVDTDTRTIRVRPAQLADMHAVQSIYAHHVRTGTGTFEEDPPCEQELAERFRGVIERSLPYNVIERGGEVLGFAYAAPFRGRSAYRFTLEDSVYVHPEAPGQGLGTQLLASVIVAAEAAGYHRMIAVIGDADNVASIHLHQRHGFERVGVLAKVGFKFGRWLDVVYMQRTLA